VPKQSGSGWQPIETAPKDGTPVLVTVMDNLQLWGYEWLQSVFGQNVTIAAWLGTPGDAMEVGWVTVATALALISGARGNFRNFSVRPTHWMPLPEPPATSAAASPESDDDVLARLPLSTRARNVLKAQRYTDWEALERLSEVADSEILRWPKVGHAVLHEIRTVLAAARPGPSETRTPSVGLQ
jgi:hypothetical protein